MFFTLLMHILNFVIIKYYLCKDQIRDSVQDEWTQAQNNEFVESGLKNQALMNWTTTRMDLKNDQARIRNIELNQFTVRGGNSSYKSIKQSSSTNLIATIFCFYFFDPLLMEGFLHYITPFGPSQSYTCRSSEPLLEYLFHQTSSLTFYEL